MFRKVYDLYNLIGANKILAALLFIGILLRLLFFIRGYDKLPISSDEAWPGLMGLHILKGEFPVVYWGQSYMGTVESFFQAIFIYIFGTIPLSVRIYPLVVGLLFMFVTFKLADEMYNRSVALISLSLVSIPTAYLSICSSLVPPDNYLATILTGSAALLFLNRVLYKPPTGNNNGENKRLRYYSLLGFLSGLGFWIHILYIDYIAVVLLFMFIHDKTFFLKKRFFVLVLFFVIGTLPLIVYNITHNLDTFTVARGVPIRLAFLKMLMLFEAVVPVLIGIKVPLYGDNPNILNLPDYFGIVLGAVYVIAFLFIIISRWKNILGFLTLSSKKLGPTELLLAFAVISIVVFSRSDRSNSWAVRYILPIFSVLPILLSFAIYEIWKKYRVLGATMFAAVLIVQLYGNGLLYDAWGSEKIVSEELGLPDDRPLIEFIKSKDINNAYAHFWISYRLTYETGEKIICAQPYDERFGGRYKPRYTEEVDKARNVVFIFHPTLGIPYDIFEENLKVIGGSYKKTSIEPYTVFYDFASPRINDYISNAGWSAESNYDNEDVKNAFDRDVLSRWATKSPQRPGAFFILDMGREQVISGLSMHLGRFKSDFPRGVIIEVSRDKRIWGTVSNLPRNIGALVWENSHPVFNMENSRTEIIFDPVKARYIKITQTSYANPFDWSIAELYVYRGDKVY